MIRKEPRQTADMTARFQEPSPNEVPWWWPVLVRCPRCRSRAIVHGGSGVSKRLQCLDCALTRDWSGERFVAGEGGEMLALSWGEATHSWLDPRTGRQWQGSWQAPYGREENFGADLWLQAECCGGHLLWARNEAHLDYIAAFVAADLREQEQAEIYKPLSHKLPKWMKSKKHRDEVLAAVDRLRSSL